MGQGRIISEFWALGLRVLSFRHSVGGFRVLGSWILWLQVLAENLTGQFQNKLGRQEHCNSMSLGFTD